MTRALATLALAVSLAASAAELPKDLPSYPGHWAGDLVEDLIEGPPKTELEREKRWIASIRHYYKKLDNAKQKELADAILECLDSENKKYDALWALLRFTSYPDEVYEDCQPMLHILLNKEKGLKKAIWKLEDDDSFHTYSKLAKRIRPQLSRLEKLVKTQ